MLLGWHGYLLVALRLALPVKAATGPWVVHHVTEPDHRSSYIRVENITNDTSLLGEGYFFVTPYISDFSSASFGPQIFDINGTLIWNGNYTAKVRAMDAHVCDYLGETGSHLCYNDARAVEQKGHSVGSIRFFDNTYTQVGSDFGSENGLRAPDIHELNVPKVVKGETFIQDVYQRRFMDLTAYNGPKDGWVLDGCFQEISLRTKELVFQWCAMDWVSVDDTYVYLYDVGSTNYSVPIAGRGGTLGPWDFFHINSIDKNEEGDYVISARHFDTVMKIAGNGNPHGVPPGTILWQLGGKHNDFTMNYNFSRQHTVRFQKTTASETVLSLFDNAFDGWSVTSKNSSGKMVSINNDSMTSTLVQEYVVPGGGLSYSQGSMQVLDNGNVLMGWGNRHLYTEYTQDGEMLYHANFPGNVESFRVWKSPWKGFPKHPPKLISYAANCTNASLHAFVSWNGATEVHAWDFYSSWSTHSGPWYHVGTAPKDGFETVANFTTLSPNSSYGQYAPYVFAKALDVQGRVLGTSNVAHTFVPKNETIYDDFNCTELICEADWFRFEEEFSCGATCQRSHKAGACALILLICIIEAIDWLGGEVGWPWMRQAPDVQLVPTSQRPQWKYDLVDDSDSPYVFTAYMEQDESGSSRFNHQYGPDTDAGHGPFPVSKDNPARPLRSGSLGSGMAQQSSDQDLTTGLGNLLMLVGLRGGSVSSLSTMRDDEDEEAERERISGA